MKLDQIQNATANMREYQNKNSLWVRHTPSAIVYTFHVHVYMLTFPTEWSDSVRTPNLGMNVLSPVWTWKYLNFQNAVYPLNFLSVGPKLECSESGDIDLYMSRNMRKPTMWVLTRSDSNQAVQLLEMGRLKFCI